MRDYISSVLTVVNMGIELKGVQGSGRLRRMISLLGRGCCQSKANGVLAAGSVGVVAGQWLGG